jgi:hypothetical protein
MREEYRRLVRPLGVEPETIYLATTRDVALVYPHRRLGGGSFMGVDDLRGSAPFPL